MMTMMMMKSRLSSVRDLVDRNLALFPMTDMLCQCKTCNTVT